jgi:hypothetical protein
MKLISADEVAERKPWIDVETGEVYFEIGGEKVFVPREVFVHIFQRHSEVIAGQANKPRWR